MINKRIVTFLGAALVSVAGPGAHAQTPPEGVGTAAQRLMMPGAMWPGGEVRICWDTTVLSGVNNDLVYQIPLDSEEFARLSGMVRRWLRMSWARVANIRFTGYDMCSDNHPGQVGVKLFHTSGASSDTGYRAGGINARLGLDRWDAQGVVLHEIGHALGFTHEMDRADFPKVSCKTTVNATGNTLGTSADFQSIMAATGYCQSNVILSAADIAGVRKAYGPRRAAIALTGGVGWGSMPVAVSNGNGGFNAYNYAPIRKIPGPPASFPADAAAPGTSKLIGDFDGDGTADLAVLGGAGWTYLDVARMLSGPGEQLGQFLDSQQTVGSALPLWFGATAATAGAVPLVGDFDGDGRDDIALTGAAGWTTLPVALSRGWNRFSAFNGAVAGYPGFPNAAVQAPIKLVGDWNGDGRSDIALLGKAGWTTLPVALGERDGTFRGANPAVASSSGYTGFVADSAAAHVTALVGDFNHDGRDDIALVGGAGWRGFRVAFGNGDGTFTARDSGMMANGDGNTSLPNLAAGAVLLSFGSDAAMDGVVPLIGDFDGDGFRDDIALTGGAGWRTVPVAYGNGDGTFTGYKPVAPIFGANSGAARARLVADFDGDGRDDVALVGGTGWGTMPVILARGTGTWDEHNDPIGGPFASDFAVAATQPGARAFAGAF